MNINIKSQIAILKFNFYNYYPINLKYALNMKIYLTMNNFIHFGLFNKEIIQ